MFDSITYIDRYLHFSYNRNGVVTMTTSPWQPLDLNSSLAARHTSHIEKFQTNCDNDNVHSFQHFFSPKVYVVMTTHHSNHKDVMDFVMTAYPTW